MKNYHSTHFTKGETIWCLARVPAPVSTGVLVRSHLTNGTGTIGTGYDLQVFDLTAGERSSAPATPIAAHTVEGGDEEDVMETGLVDDNWWKGGGDGYTFRDSNGVELANPVGGHVYRLVYLLNTIDYGQVPLVFDMTCDGHEGTVTPA